MTGVESRQMKILAERRNNLLEKRRRRAEREEGQGHEGVAVVTS